MKKKLFAMVLTLCMVLAMLPVSASAQGVEILDAYLDIDDRGDVVLMVEFNQALSYNQNDPYSSPYLDVFIGTGVGGTIAINTQMLDGKYIAPIDFLLIDEAAPFGTTSHTAATLVLKTGITGFEPEFTYEMQPFQLDITRTNMNTVHTIYNDGFIETDSFAGLVNAPAFSTSPAITITPEMRIIGGEYYHIQIIGEQWVSLDFDAQGNHAAVGFTSDMQGVTIESVASASEQNGIFKVDVNSYPLTYQETAPTTPPATSPTEPIQPTTDTPSDWALDQVNEAIAANIVPESLQTMYTQATTRAEFCALAVALYETSMGTEITERATFDDTDDLNVQKMAGLGVVNGVGEGKFNPDEKLTREQAAVILARLSEVMDNPLDKVAATFADNDDVSDWALEAVGQMLASGIMGGVGDNKFSPKADYTREQSILTTLRVFNLVK